MNKKDEISKAVSAFRTKIAGAAEGLYEASKIYADAVTRHGDDACRAFDKAFPGVSRATWDKMRLVAKDALVPEALLVSDRVAARIGYLPIDEQRKRLGGRKTVKVVTPTGNVVTKALARLTPNDERTVFSPSGKIRTEAEQRKWIAERTASAPASQAYEVRGNFLVVFRATKIGKAELLDIVRRMK